MVSLGAWAFAQNVQIVSLKMKDHDCYNDDYANPTPTPFTQTGAYYSSLRGTVQSTNGSGRTLSFTQLGTAGNLYTILDGTVNRIAVNNDLNTVVFIHRANPDSAQHFPALPANSINVGQYTYDISTDLGGSWSLDNGILNPQGNNIDLAGRYPNVTIYNPIGNSTLGNAYLSYLGSWLPFSTGGADWEGFFYGVASLDGDTSTVTADTTKFNNGLVNVAKGLCQGAPGIFWAVDFEYDGTQYGDILLYKGVWNPSTSNTDWFLDRKLDPGYDITFDGTSQATALNMAFDHTGQYGWIVFTGDVVAGGNNAMNPVFYNTTDGGLTWNGPTSVDLSTLDNVQASMPTPLTDFPQTGFDCDIVVDANGNPHAVFTIGSGGGSYDIQTPQTGTYGLINMWDITKVPGASKGCEWQAIFLDSLATFRGAITGAVDEDNRPQASASADGTKLIFGWGDSGLNSVGGDNSSPNLITVGLDVTTGKATEPTNQTDSTTFEGAAFFISFAPTCITQGNDVKAATVFGQLNPLTLNDEDPAFFHYVDGVQYDVTSDFTIDVYPPVITLSGTNPMTVVQGNSYTEPGATASDNVDGTIAFGNFSVSGTVNTSAVGTYTISYSVSDAAGNTACTVTRTVNVVAAPDNVAPTITLVGADTIYADICEFFSDPGATANDDVDGDITANITTTNNVQNGGPGNPGTAGTYSINYNVSDGAGNTASETRTVILADEAPTITLVGGSTDTVEVCNTYSDPGYFGYDNCLGIVAVSVSGSVDTTTPGNYTLTYSATDGTNPATATRVVTVLPDATPPTITLAPPSTVYVYLGDPYVEPGFTTDDCSGIASTVVDTAAVNVTSTGTYTVTYTVTDNNNNVATATRTVIVGSEPEARFVYSTTNNSTYSFTDSSLYDPTSWLWDLGDGSSTSQRNPTYTYLTDGQYTVCLTAKNNFNDPPFSKPADSTCKVINVTVGVEDLSLLDASFQLFPNPTTGTLNLNVKGSNFENLQVNVINIIGETMIVRNFGKVQASSTLSMDMSSLADGVYMIRISTEQGVITKRVSLHTF